MSRSAIVSDAGRSVAKSKLWQNETRSEEHTSELQSRSDLVCRLLLEKKKKTTARDVQSQGRTSEFHTRRELVPRGPSYMRTAHRTRPVYSSRHAAYGSLRNAVSSIAT